MVKLPVTGVVAPIVTLSSVPLETGAIVSTEPDAGEIVIFCVPVRAILPKIVVGCPAVPNVSDIVGLNTSVFNVVVRLFVIVRFVKVPAAGIVAPIVILSIFPTVVGFITVARLPVRFNAPTTLSVAGAAILPIVKPVNVPGILVIVEPSAVCVSNGLPL